MSGLIRQAGNRLARIGIGVMIGIAIFGALGILSAILHR